MKYLKIIIINYTNLYSFYFIEFQISLTTSQHQQRVFAISALWFKQWENFVQQQQSISVVAIDVPGKIDNLAICMKPSSQRQQQQHQPTSAKAKKKAKKQPAEFTLNTSKILTRYPTFFNRLTDSSQESKYYKISEEMWSFLHGVYGGGPPLEVKNVFNPVAPYHPLNSDRIDSIPNSKSRHATSDDEDAHRADNQPPLEQIIVSRFGRPYLVKYLLDCLKQCLTNFFSQLCSASILFYCYSNV